MSVRNSSPRILYITQSFPPCGAQERSLNVLRALQQMGMVEVVVLDKGNTDRDPILDSGCTIRALYACRQISRLKSDLIEKMKRKVSPRSHYPFGWRAPDEAIHLASSLNEFDLIWFFELRTAEMFPNAAWPRSVIDIDDVQSAWEDAALRAETGLRHRLLTLTRALSWRGREKLLSDRFTVLTVCSEEDRQYLQRLGLKAPIHVIPNGFNKPCREPVRTPTSPARIGFIGHFSHPPNYEGIHWFVKKCWPLIKREIPDVRLRLIGPGSDRELRPFGPDIDGLGWLANPSDEMKTWSLMVIPIRVGGGTRVKIAHGFSLKCPIVSTSFGARGYLARSAGEMYLADSVETFSRACMNAIRDPAEAAQMAERAWRQFLKEWTWEAIRPLVWAAAEDCLRLNGRGSSSIDGPSPTTASAD